MGSPLLHYFRNDHLHPDLAVVSQGFAELAESVDNALPDSAEKTVAIRKLLEAKDAAVRAAVDALNDSRERGFKALRMDRPTKYDERISGPGEI
jgi:hypothetical protein